VARNHPAPPIGGIGRKRSLDYKSAIVRGLEELEATLPPNSHIKNEYAKLKKQALAESDRRRLFFMWQTVREVLAKSNEEEKLDTSFQVKTKEGKVVTYKTLDEMAQDRAVVCGSGSVPDHDRS
jgi:hypothetical protein